MRDAAMLMPVVLLLLMVLLGRLERWLGDDVPRVAPRPGRRRWRRTRRGVEVTAVLDVPSSRRHASRRNPVVARRRGTSVLRRRSAAGPQGRLVTGSRARPPSGDG